MSEWLIQTGKGKGSYRTVSTHTTCGEASSQYRAITLAPGEKKRLVGKPNPCSRFLTFFRHINEEASK
jgi:hypothetical protein